MNYFDLHCDAPYRCFEENLSLLDERLSVNFSQSSAFEKWYQCFAVWIKDGIRNPFEYYKKVVADFRQKIKSAPENLVPILTVENAALLENDIERISVLKRDGVRSVTLTWNGQNCIAGGCHTSVGLSEFGRDVINEFNRQKIACDLSHINKKSFFPALELADFPMLSHSCLASLQPHRRNMSDRQAKMIAQKGGIIGICFYPEFLPQGDVFEGIYANVYNLLDAGLEDTIALGSDFDGADMDEKLAKSSDISALYGFLLGKSIPQAVLNKIFFENALKFYTKL